jgi:hypothetical protein
MNTFTNTTYYTITPVNRLESSWQPEAIINNKIHVDADLISNWKYRQYIQNNSNQIMKYNTMEYIYSSGNNPYTVSEKISNENVPYKFSSLYDPKIPNVGFSNSDLKQDFLYKQQLSGRMIAPSFQVTPKK